MVLNSVNQTDGRIVSMLFDFETRGMYNMQPFFGEPVCWLFDLDGPPSLWNFVLYAVLGMPSSFEAQAQPGNESTVRGQSCRIWALSLDSGGGWTKHYFYCITADGICLQGNTSNIKDGEVRWGNTMNFLDTKLEVPSDSVTPPSGCDDLKTQGTVATGKVNSPTWIKAVNAAAGGVWQAGPNLAFENTTWEQNGTKLTGAKMGALSLSLAPMLTSGPPLPSGFDAREHWKDCASISLIRNQGECGSCWAFSSAEALADRICVAGGNANLTLSVQYMIDNAKANSGCNGGFLDNAWKFLRDTGTVLEKCDPKEHCEYPASITCEPPSKSLLQADSCKKPVHYRAESAYAVAKPGQSAAMAREIMQSGPIQAAFFVFQDFMAYEKGIYFRTSASGGMTGGHAIKIIGWGVEKEKKYWIVANSWGPNWGEDGFFRIQRGNNECGIESIPAAGKASP